MEDISKELWKDIEADFLKNYNSSSRIGFLMGYIKDGKGNYSHAERFANEVGKLWSNSLMKFLTEENLPDGKLYWNIAQKTIVPALMKDFEQVAEYTEMIQNALNEASGIGFKAVVPPVNKSRINHLVDKISDTEKTFAETSHLINNRTLVNFSKSVVTDFVKENARVQKAAGLGSWITRKSSDGCCKWCSSLLGTFDYDDVPDDFWRVHDDCNCVIEFHPVKRRPQRITFETTQNGKFKVTEEI